MYFCRILQNKSEEPIRLPVPDLLGVLLLSLLHFPPVLLFPLCLEAAPAAPLGL